MISSKWQGAVAFMLLIVMLYIDRVNMHLQLLDQQFLVQFGFSEPSVAQGLALALFLIGYGFSMLLITPLLESKFHYRTGVTITVLFWAAVCALSPLLGSLSGFIVSRILTGAAHGPILCLKIRYLNDHFPRNELGRASALTLLGAPLGLVVGLPLVNVMIHHLGGSGAAWGLAAFNLLCALLLIGYFLPAEQSRRLGTRLRIRTTLRLAWQTPLPGWLFLLEVASLGYLWGSSSWLPLWLLETRHFSLPVAGWLAAIPFALCLGAKMCGGMIIDKQPAERTPLLLIYCAALTALSIAGLAFSQQSAWIAFWLLSASIFWGLQSAVIPVMVQQRARPEAVASAWGIVSGMAHLCAAAIPVAMGIMISHYGSAAVGFSVLTASQLVTLAGGSILLLRLRRAPALLA
ncbi:MFS transporter [Entomohabitans teleogrylli]|uniref:MFS transporter n=1 Tax=Entomohabitans teleogrylli TaxID=1384589 RepID=UPI00073D1BF7|nr:MFS transporter [Entomohabitans teleogrylli]